MYIIQQFFPLFHSKSIFSSLLQNFMFPCLGFMLTGDRFGCKSAPLWFSKTRKGLKTDAVNLYLLAQMWFLTLVHAQKRILGVGGNKYTQSTLHLCRIRHTMRVWDLFFFSFEALTGEPRCFYWTLLDPYTYFLSSWRLLLLDPWTFASALELLCSSLCSGPEKKTALEHSSVLNTQNTWESQHWV